VTERLDDERLEILRQWGAGLATDSREELRAAGKAITVLIEEIDQLQVDLWSTRVDQHEPDAAPAKPTAQGAALRERLARATQTA
jgi:hypothetical protein